MHARLPKYISLFSVSIFLLLCLSACGGASSNNTTTGSKAVVTDATPTAAPQFGTQPCPAVVSEPSHWNPILSTDTGLNTVVSVTCAEMTNDTSLQALVISRYEGAGQTADIYVFTNITSPSPKQIFKLHGLYKGDAKISAYNTLLTAEVDQGSSINAGNQTAENYKQDLYREFKWSSSVGTLVPVSFPGIFPDLTRYQAENSQQQVNQNKQTVDSPTQVADKLAAKLLDWPADAPTTVVSGGNSHDKDAVIMVKNAGGTIKVTLSRLEGNTNNGIWEATSVTSDGLTITKPESRDLLSGTTTVSGTAPGGTNKIKILDHLYNSIGTADANGNFSTNISYKVSFKGGAQEGLLALYSYNGNTISGAVIFKELLNA